MPVLASNAVRWLLTRSTAADHVYMFSAPDCASASSDSMPPAAAPAAPAAFRKSRREGAPFQVLLMPLTPQEWLQRAFASRRAEPAGTQAGGPLPLARPIH